MMPSSTAQQFDSHGAFMDHLRRNVDIVFPAIHGNFGEGGGLQHMLEEAGLPFVGTSSGMAARLFDKHRASLELEAAGYATLPSFLIQICSDRTRNDLRNWFLKHCINEASGRVVVKPVSAGSSVGVTVAFGVDEAIRHAEDLLSQVDPVDAASCNLLR
ncbi:hypothetical protein CBR_g45569 [Chara braunii]|uniref:D-alanine--D-alanine ligase N-terminal domain-containing protein n=1 Tax=Chara braunii TaxID=69332 RepID=A0A388LZ51_CHABU|nr:hypothetical protein CBR_g45569 [Chara braunii]|eukprot:GBG87512.1 hypothetical protein CBR_g45569 [Chara braunii]